MSAAGGWLHAWRAAARIARRDAWRRKGRSILVVVLVALPVTAATGADVLARSFQLTPYEQAVHQTVGADALLRTVDGGEVIQDVRGNGYGSIGKGVLPTPTMSDIRGALPGADVLGEDQMGVYADVSSHTTFVEATLIEGPAAMRARVLTQVAGRFPSTSDEIDVTATGAATLHARVGDVVPIGPAQTRRPLRIVGIVRQNARDQLADVVALPAAFPTSPTDTPTKQYLVWRSRAITWRDVRRFNHLGFFALVPALVAHPPSKATLGRPGIDFEPPVVATRGPDAAAITDVAVAVTMCLLQIVLLAGPAFAIGARAQRRQLALVAASGGDQRHARNVVLSYGLVLGGVGGLVGSALGVGAGMLARQIYMSHGTIFGGFHFHYGEIAALAFVGMLTGLAAAWAPARSVARDDVVGALANHRAATRSARRPSIFGAAMVVIGLALTLLGAIAAPRNAAVPIGVGIGEIGLVLLTPAVVALVARRARPWLPYAPRLAMRELGRHRLRTVCAVAAIMAAAAGAVAAGVYSSSRQAVDRRAYTPQVPVGDGVLWLGEAASAQDASNAAAALRPLYPVGKTFTLRSADQCAMGQGACFIDAVVLPRVNPGTQPVSLLVGDATLVRALTGDDDPAIARVLQAGGAALIDSLFIDSQGHVTLQRTANGPEGPPLAKVAVPAVLVHPRVRAQVFAAGVVSVEAARALGAKVTTTAVVVQPSRMPTSAQARSAERAVENLPGIDSLAVERGFHGGLAPTAMFLLLAAAVVAVAAAGVTTALAMADARTDHLTFVAVGAAPATRRLLGMSSAGVTTLLGAALGCVTGLVPAVALIRIDGVSRWPRPVFAFSVPWWLIPGVLIGLPCVAALCAGVFTRSQRSFERQVA